MKKESDAMSLSLRIIIVSGIDIAVTDSVIYFHLKQNPAGLTLPLLIAWILITLLPIMLTLWVWRNQQSKKQGK
jgi:hypothetical protein